MNLKTLLPTVIVDTREQAPLQFASLPFEVDTLATGDYSARGLESDISIERKSISDLIGSLTSGRERFMRELERMRAFPFRRLLIVGTVEEIGAHKYRGNTSPKAILHSLHAIEARGVPIVFEREESKAAELVERWIWWRARAVMAAASEISKHTTGPGI